MELKGKVKPSRFRPDSGIGYYLHQMSVQWELCLIALPFVIYIFIFSYVPLWGLTMAFQDYVPGRAFADQTWVGIGQFRRLFSDTEFLRVLRNTFAMGGINIVFHFVSAILFALLLNELIAGKFRRVVQTISYMPHFLSWIIVTGLVANFLTMDGGVVNEVMLAIGLIDQPIHFLGTQSYVWWIVGWSNVWKSMGWNSIIYLAAITSIDPALYEAASIDGCSRFKRNLYITLPGIKSTIIVLLILNAGWILNVSFEIPYLLFGTGTMLDVSETIDLYVIRKGYANENYSLATAAGLFKTAFSVVLIALTNWLAGKFGEDKLI